MSRMPQLCSARDGVIPSRPHATYWRLWPRNGVSCSNISDKWRTAHLLWSCRANMRRFSSLHRGDGAGGYIVDGRLERPKC